MFGSNPVRHQELSTGGTLWVQSVFYTLQGEGPFAGQPSVFVRLAGCNLRCWFCDTDFESSTWRPMLDELLATICKVKPPYCDLIVITGGEPFRQNIIPLVDALLRASLRVQIETNGTLWIELPNSPNLSIVCSPKTPLLNNGIVPRISVYKYVIGAGETSGEDGLPGHCSLRRDRQIRLARPISGVPVYVMPRDDGNAEDNARNLETCRDVALKFGYRLTLQLHKLLQID